MINMLYNGHNPVAFWAIKILPLLIIATGLFFMVQRRFMKTVGPKRLATLYFLTALAALLGVSLLVERFSLPDLWLLPALLITASMLILRKKQTFPFPKGCIKCGEKLSFYEKLFVEENNCKKCREDKE